MPAPTLLVPGSLRAPADADQKQPPINFIIDWLKARMPEFGGRSAAMADRVLVIQSETGSGKSTVLPASVFRILRSESTPAKMRYNGPSVLCTQPRVLTAITLARQGRASPHYAEMREVTGFQTGALSDKPMSGLIFATIGVLAAQLKTLEDEMIMDKYRFIIVDEAHERSKEADMTLLRLKNFFSRNSGNKKLPFLLLASATFDTNRYAKFFGVDPATNVVKVSGRAYPIVDNFPAAGHNDYIEAAAAKALEIHERNPEDLPKEADILIFMPGNEEIEGVATILKGAAQRAKNPFAVLLVNREAILDDTPDYRQIFVPPAALIPVRGMQPVRRIIISTVVAETGLTVETLKYVIDCGWSRTIETYQPWGVSGLTTRPAPQSRIAQRKGRAGRLFPGEFYPLYTKNVYNSLEPLQLPDIVTGGVKEIFLDIVDEQLRQKSRAESKSREFRIEDIDMLDVPPADALTTALETAEVLGFVSPDVCLDDTTGARGYGLTAMGKIAAKFSRIPPEGARIIFAGLVHKANLRDLATVVSAFGKPLASFFAEPPTPIGLAKLLSNIAPPVIRVSTIGGADTAAAPRFASHIAHYRTKLLIADNFIETLFLLDAFGEKISQSQKIAQSWCLEFGIDITAIIRMIETRDEIINDLLVAGLDPFRTGRRLSDIGARTGSEVEFLEAVRSVKRCIYDGLRLNLLRYDEKRDTYLSRHGLEVSVSVLSDKEASEIGCEQACRPLFVVTDSITVSSQRKKDIMYSLKAKMFSVLDGFVELDHEFATFPETQLPQSIPVSADARAKLNAYRRACSAKSVAPMTRRLPKKVREIILAGRFNSLEMQ